MSEASIERLVKFAESGNQQKIIINGTSYQGWIMEINEEALLMSTGFNEKSGQDNWINFDEIDISRLEFWDIREQHWMTWVMPD